MLYHVKCIAKIDDQVNDQNLFLFNEYNNMCWALRRACSHDSPGQKPYCMSCRNLFKIKS